jgi:hypothetical protein
VNESLQDGVIKLIPIHTNGMCLTEEGFEEVLRCVANVVSELKHLVTDENRTEYSANRMFAEFSSVKYVVGRSAMHQLGAKILGVAVPKRLRKMFCGQRGAFCRNRFASIVLEGIDGKNANPTLRCSKN